MGHTTHYTRVLARACERSTNSASNMTTPDSRPRTSKIRRMPTTIYQHQPWEWDIDGRDRVKKRGTERKDKMKCLQLRSVVLLLHVFESSHAFTGRSNPSFRHTSFSVQNNALPIGPLKSSSEGILDNPASFITPEGFGFSCPASRILTEAQRMNGFHKASDQDGVLSVMDAITGGNQDAALVFDSNDKLLGLFTESDYIKFSTARVQSSNNEEESASFLVAPVKDYVTPASNLIAVSPSEVASAAIALMQESNIRHLVVADSVSSNRLQDDSKILGVINLQDVMTVVQKDERVSLVTLTDKYPKLRNRFDQMRDEMCDTANSLANTPEKAKQDIIAVGASLLFAGAFASFLSQSAWLHDHSDIAMIGIFVLGYLGIIFEEVIEFNKAGIALLMSTGLWVTYADYYQSAGVASEEVIRQLGEQLAEVSDICFFLLAASTIVEVVDLHQGFKVVTNQIKTTSKKQLFWTIGFITFFLSAILNNLTVTIVMISLLRKLVPRDEERLLFGAMVVVAANAGGVWTPIGDVTTTMLWINNQLSTVPTVTELFLPSVVCLVGSLAFLVNQVEEDETEDGALLPEPTPLSARGNLVFWSGIASLLSVPVFAELTGLPPYLAMLTGLGFMWTLTDVIHLADEEEGLKVPAALERLDTSGILFFLGILMSIGVLDKSGLLKDLAVYLSETLPSLDIIATVIGIASALIDNVPLVVSRRVCLNLVDLMTYLTSSLSGCHHGNVRPCRLRYR